MTGNTKTALLVPARDISTGRHDEPKLDPPNGGVVEHWQRDGIVDEIPIATYFMAPPMLGSVLVLGHLRFLQHDDEGMISINFDFE